MNINNINTVLSTLRLPFVILTPACVLLGLSTAVWSSADINIFYFVLVLIGAVSAHISVNAFNEYFDFKSGLDSKTKRTPFSGGSGALQKKPELADWTLTIAITSFVITSLIGIFFIFTKGFLILPLGIAGLVIIALYTNHLTRNPVLCLIAPGLGFGTFMVMGTHFVLTGAYSWTAFLVSLIPFFLVSNLLLLNQFPDVEADRTVGRKHFPILIGKRASSLIYGVFILMPFIAIFISVNLGCLPYATLIGLFALITAVPAAIGAYRHANESGRLLSYMGLNVLTNLLTPVLVSIGLLVG